MSMRVITEKSNFRPTGKHKNPRDPSCRIGVGLINWKGTTPGCKALCALRHIAEAQFGTTDAFIVNRKWAAAGLTDVYLYNELVRLMPDLPAYIWNTQKRTLTTHKVAMRLYNMFHHYERGGETVTDLHDRACFSKEHPDVSPRLKPHRETVRLEFLKGHITLGV